MMPRALGVSGLHGALEDLVNDLGKQGLQCRLEMISMSAPLPPAMEMMLYRILQELCSNVVKHARASELLIQLLRDDQELTVIVEDNGRGFELDQARNKNGIGLSSIQSRVEYLNGVISWDSVPGQGTTVSIHLPVR
jgi:signal transduction histidine kinase